MAGIVVTDNISTSGSADTYATHLASLGQGGHRTVQTLIELYAIPLERREFGMLVSVINDTTITNNHIWQLANIALGGINNTLIDNANWIELSIGSGNSATINYTISAIPDATFGDATMCFFDGTGDSNITSYNQGVIYIVTFNNYNLGPTSLNINNIGSLEILKGDVQLGLISLNPNDIIAGIGYYLIYDGVQFQYFNTSPAVSAGSYTNLNPVPINLGGVLLGTTFNNITYKQLFDQLFYPYLSPTFNNFYISGQTTVLEVGNSIPSGVKTFLWSNTNVPFIRPNTINIINNTGGIALGTLLPNTDTFTYTLTSPITRTTAGYYYWTIQASSINSINFTRQFIVYWEYRHYYGNSTHVTLTSADILGLSTSGLASNNAGNYGFSAMAGNYKYFAFPDSLGSPSANIGFRDISTGFVVSMADNTDNASFSNVQNGWYYALVSVTNPTYGTVANYRVYRTKNILGGNITITVS